MIKYSVGMRKNPSSGVYKAYATAQVTETLTLPQFAEHISEHHSKYGKGDIYCVLIEMVSCMREQLLLGNKIQLGDMGNFYITLSSKGADTCADFSSQNIKAVNVTWERGKDFKDLVEDAGFEEVGTRKEQAELLKNKKEESDAEGGNTGDDTGEGDETGSEG